MSVTTMQIFETDEHILVHVYILLLIVITLGNFEHKFMFLLIIYFIIVNSSVFKFKACCSNAAKLAPYGKNS